jgi:hypothetical protein
VALSATIYSFAIALADADRGDEELRKLLGGAWRSTCLRPAATCSCRSATAASPGP